MSLPVLKQICHFQVSNVKFGVGVYPLRKMCTSQYHLCIPSEEKDIHPQSVNPEKNDGWKTTFLLGR